MNIWKKLKRKKCPKCSNKKIGILLDYENIASEGIKKGATISYQGLHNLFKSCTKYGQPIFQLAFLPDHFIRNTSGGNVLLDLFNTGFTPFVCKTTSGKEKDRVDYIMTEWGKRLIDYSSIEKIIIISHDKDFIPLYNYAIGRQVKPILMSGKKISQVFKNIVELHAPLPSLK
jgi:uncharacterized LabA/DUF88 family protein